jgi:hypothetical protein
VIHTLQEISRELERVSQRPPRNEAPPVLSTFDVTTFDSADEYVAGLRSTLCAALKLAISESFDGEDFPSGSLRRAVIPRQPHPISRHAGLSSISRKSRAGSVADGSCGSRSTMCASGWTVGVSPSSRATSFDGSHTPPAAKMCPGPSC